MRLGKKKQVTYIAMSVWPWVIEICCACAWGIKFKSAELAMSCGGRSEDLGKGQERKDSQGQLDISKVI
jgi:hypothetical protein